MSTSHQVPRPEAPWHPATRSLAHSRGVLKVLDAAVASPPGQRPAVLDRLCGDDAELRREVASLLEFEQQASGFLAEAAAAPPAEALAPETSPVVTAGTILSGRYRVLGLLGRGGMGAVYAAADQTLDQQVALKLLPPAWVAGPRGRERFLEEVRIARQVSHPNVCRVFDFGEADDRHFLSMELIEGEDLASLLRRAGAPPRDQALEIALQACRGLAAVHERGIVHRDLKPANLMLDAEGRVRILDFGLAALAETTGGAELRSGTPAYMAPEQSAGREHTERSDLYALGLVLYELFTGRRAFDADALAELARQHREDPPARPSRWQPDLGPAIERAVLRCLAKDPGERPASAEAVEMMLGRRAVEPETGTFLKTVVVGAPEGNGRRVDARNGIGIEDLLEQHGGREIALSTGFGWLFERPWAAVRCALAYLAPKRQGPAVGIGIHLGDVELRGPDSEESDSATAEGSAIDQAAALAALAGPGQILLTGHAFDLARRSAFAETASEQLHWLAHGGYRFRDRAQPVEIFEVGDKRRAPLEAPAGSAQVTPLPAADTISGWRPSPGLAVPNRPGWRLERMLGEGGFGEAWLAGHRQSGERRVFKFCFEASLLRGLRREITIFRLLKEELGERPDIARLLDWNLEVAPYFVESEYSAGGSLEEWALAQGELSNVLLETRLEIVAQVAEALAAAHAVGVLHKDVKPGNILISPGRPRRIDPGREVRARLADFGIGLVTDRDRLAGAGFTVMGMTRTEDDSGSQTGTRLYMAPELLEGKPASLQTDVYALGVTLFQMVAGDLARALAPGWRDEIDDPLLVDDVAAAVHGSPDRRLRDAAQLAERLRSLPERHRQREAEREAKRHAARQLRQRKWLAATVTVLLILGVAMAAMIYRVRQEAERANRAAEASERVSQFFIDLFETADPWADVDAGEPVGASMTAKQLLDRGTRKLETELIDQPEIRARLMNTLSTIYRSLDLDADGTELARRALEIRRQLFGNDHPLVAESLYELAWRAADDRETVALHRQALAIRRRILGDQHPKTAESLHGLARVLYFQGDYKEAEPMLRQALAIQRKSLGDQHELVAWSWIHLGLLLIETQELDKAERSIREALAISRRQGRTAVVANALFSLGYVLAEEDDWAGAEPLFRESLSLKHRGVFGEEHLSLLYGEAHLALAHIRLGKVLEAEPAIRHVVEVSRRSRPENDFSRAFFESIMGACLDGLGRHEEAEVPLLEALSVIQTVRGDFSTKRKVLRNLIEHYEATGEPEEASKYHELWIAAGGGTAPRATHARLNRAANLAGD